MGPRRRPRGHEADFRTTANPAGEAGQTRIALRSVFPTAQERDRVVKPHGALEGGEQILHRLAKVLAGT